MKVLIVNITKPNIDTRSIKLKRALVKQGHNVEFYWALQTKSVKVFGKTIPGVGYFVTLIKNLVVAIRSNFDVVHLIDGWDIALLPFMFTNKVKVFDIRSGWSYMSRRAWTNATRKKTKIAAFVKDIFTKILISRSNTVVTVDPRLGQIVSKLGAKNLVFLRNLPEEDMFDCVPFNRNPDFVDFAYVGTFATVRRTKELLQAWHKFVGTKPCRLFLIGWDCSGEKYFENEMEKYIDNKTVFYMGRVSFENIAKSYREMDFIVVPNMGDHWQLKLGESLAAKVPVILRDGILHRMIAGEKGVTYFKSDIRETDTEAILHALVIAYKNRDLLIVEARNKTPPFWEYDVKKLVNEYQR